MRQRIKLYKLNDKGTWDDKGTGHVNVEWFEHCHAVGLHVVSELDGMSLLMHQIKRDVVYQRQGDDTIITWTDVELDTDVALSFQDPAGCAAIWQNILEVQAGAHLRSTGPLQPSQHHSHGDNAGGSNSPRPMSHHMGGMVDDYDTVTVGGRFDEFIPGTVGAHHLGASIQLPLPTFETLGTIAKALSEVTIFQRDAIAGQLLRRGCIDALVECFKRAEDLEDEESLHALYEIFKHAILLNDTNLFELLITDEYILDVIGALEYEPGTSVDNRTKHRQFLTEQAHFKEVVPLADPALKSKINQTYRIGYLKDVILAKVLDDATFSTISSLLLFNHVEVLVGLNTDPNFFNELLRRLREAETGSPQWKDLVAFLQELCGLVRHLQATQRNALLSRLVELGLFEVMSSVLQSGDDEARLKATDILLADASHDPMPLRNFLVQENNELLPLLINAFVTPSSSGLQEQVLEILKVLLDPDTMDTQVEKDAFCDRFYKVELSLLVAALVRASEQPDAPDAVSPTTITLIVELLCHLLQTHAYRIKYYVLRNGIFEKVLKLLKRREKWVVAAAIRFFRAGLGMKDTFYNQYIVKQGLMEPVITAFLQTGDQYNMLNSSILELFDFIRKENMKTLVHLVVQSPQWPALLAVDYVDTFKALQIKHDQNEDGGGLSGPASGLLAGDPANQEHMGRQEELQRATAAAEARRLRGEKEDDYDEESYFSKDDDTTEDGNGVGDHYLPNIIPTSAPLPINTSGGPSLPPSVIGPSLSVQQEQRDPLALPPLNLLPLPKRKAEDDDDEDFFVKKPKIGPNASTPKIGIAVPGVMIGPASGSSNGKVTIQSTSPASFLPTLVDYDSDDNNDDNKAAKETNDAPKENEGVPASPEVPSGQAVGNEINKGDEAG